ncbi:MAG: UbiX family flavin prenyltransferase, partial [Candidatus Dadabacteria bacterium]
MRRFVIGITGASGVIYGVRLLQVLREMPDVQTHLVLSRAARETLVLETEWAPEAVEALADRAYDPDDLAAPIASGSVPTDGMAIVPCSMKTLSAVAHSFAHNLIVRAA